MKWLVIIILAMGMFISGALYGIDKNQEKERDVLVTSDNETFSKKNQITNACEPQRSPEEKPPWITQLAEGMGEAVAISFNGILVIVSEFFSSVQV